MGFKYIVYKISMYGYLVCTNRHAEESDYTIKVTYRIYVIYRDGHYMKRSR